ncbi:MAG: flagellar type III secretion system protein FlhB [Rhodobacteraceae bacterium]|jgi:flagellar biosynthetic protein FlhB|nr:flagellar type III secretion system protein FlhB [Paracoccaceae bacterium]
MSGSGEDDRDGPEKEHEPSPQKLEEARRQGDVPRSPDLVAAAAAAGLLAALAGLGGWTAERLGTAGAVVLGQADRLAPLLTAGPALAGGLLGAVAVALAPLLLLPALAALAALAGLRALLVTPGRLVPRLSRLNPVSNARAKFGRDGLFDFAKSALRLSVIAGLLGAYLLARLPRMLELAALGPGPAAQDSLALTVEFLAMAVAIAVPFGILDLLWQRAAHRRRNRMSREELMEELKRSEGDPHLRGERRRRGRAIATSRMLADVGKADVVIVNPAHYAVALKWQRGDRGAPRCLAKGVDAMAARIREAAQAAGVPLHRDPATARALHATVEVGGEIRPEHYRAVAAAIRFAEAIRARARARGRPPAAGPAR